MEPGSISCGTGYMKREGIAGMSSLLFSGHVKLSDSGITVHCALVGFANHGCRIHVTLCASFNL